MMRYLIIALAVCGIWVSFVASAQAAYCKEGVGNCSAGVRIEGLEKIYLEKYKGKLVPGNRQIGVPAHTSIGYGIYINIKTTLTEVMEKARK